jgi:Flp pilus assembly protein TadD
LRKSAKQRPTENAAGQRATSECEFLIAAPVTIKAARFGSYEELVYALRRHCHDKCMGMSSELLAQAISHQQAGQLQQAERIYQQILSADPNNADAWHLLGLVALQLGRHEVAAAYIGRAVALAPSDPDAHNNLGTAFKSLGKLDDAVGLFHRAVQLRPDFVEALSNLANVLQEQQRFGDAETVLRRLLQLTPNNTDAHYKLGVSLQKQQRLEEAAECYRRSVALKPDFAEAHSNLGSALRLQEKTDEAVQSFERALALKATDPELQFNLGVAVATMGDVDRASQCFRRAIELNPNHAEAHFNLGGLSLLRGDFASGWPEYEWRWRTGLQQPRQFSRPSWDGRPLNGQTILIYAEQGIGDTIQFVRYASLVKELGGTVVMECPKALQRLLETCRGIDRLIGEGDELPSFDAQVALLSLPGILKTTVDTIPGRVPYLYADRGLVDWWHERLRGVPGFRIGIHWQGRAGYGAYQWRHIPVEYFTALAATTGARLISLQKETNDPSLALRAGVVDFGEELDTRHGAFMDTAAIMMNLDLVITSDTSVAHLAGAMGVPVWVALPFVPDWRWMLERSDSPWYPTMRLFRQKSRGDWAGVFKEIEAALREQVRARQE